MAGHIWNLKTILEMAMTLAALALAVEPAAAQEMMPPSPLPTLPFTVKVTEEKLDPVPPYMDSCHAPHAHPGRRDRRSRGDGRPCRRGRRSPERQAKGERVMPEAVQPEVAGAKLSALAVEKEKASGAHAAAKNRQ